MENVPITLLDEKWKAQAGVVLWLVSSEPVMKHFRAKTEEPFNHYLKDAFRTLPAFDFNPLTYTRFVYGKLEARCTKFSTTY